MDTGSRPIMTYGAPVIKGGSDAPRNSTLTAQEVHRSAAALQNHLKLTDYGTKCRAGTLITPLFYAAARITSLSNACKSLRPSSRAWRLALPSTSRLANILALISR